MEGVRALYQYRGPLRSAVHRVKYRGERRRAAQLATVLAAAAPELVSPWRSVLTCVVPVPLHPIRQRERGFNQSTVLACCVARSLDRPLFEDLCRRRWTSPQVGQDRAARWNNVAGAFRWNGGPLTGTVLLVDDVVTTGATIVAASEALVTAGAQAVVVLALARAATYP
ncbi:MAG: ComF family protein [Thermomicrobium sp.]|nr:ComF family protein [Thermomicrobium sp.]MDW7982727.1 ComF family protein [Thermomicrobium sp.]